MFIAGLSLQAPSAQPWQAEEADAYANRGVAFLEQFRFSDAASAFEAFVELEPENAAGHINLGIAYFNEREFDKASASLTRALSLAPDNPYVHYNLGLIYKLQGKTAAAVEALERVAAIDPIDSMTHYYLGSLYASLGRLEEAEASFRRTLELQPDNESAHFSLGNALIRQGRRDEGRAELMAFQELRANFPGEGASAGLQYTELGKYAEAIESAPSALQPVSVERTVATTLSFVEAGDELGVALAPLPAPPPMPDRVEASAYDSAWIAQTLLAPLGSGLAFRDINADETPDLLFVRNGAPVVLVNINVNGRGRFAPVTDSGLPSRGRFVGVVLGDVDNDGDADVYLSGIGPNALYLNDGSGRFVEAADEVVRGDDISVSATFADVDHDGDLDLYVSNYVDPEPPSGREVLSVPADLPGAPNRLYRNNGDGSFTDVAAETGTDGGRARSLGALFSDLDDDRDLDFIVINDGAPARVFSNDRVGTFTDATRSFGLETGLRMRGADSADFDRDGSFDVFLTAAGSSLNSLMRGPAIDGFRPDVLSPGLLAAGVPNARYGASFVDADNDGDLDLLLVVNEADAIAAYYENTPSGYVRAHSLIASGVSGEGRALALADVDSDGDVDAVVATQLGELAYFRNEGGNARAFVRVRARGLRSNLDALGTKVEVKAGAATTRREVRSASGYFSQNELPLHFGLGERSAADYVRFLWPGGVKQIEMDVEGGGTARIEELNRKGTSCPILYAWDGDKVRFVTDFLGGSAYGNLHAPGRYNYPDTDEIVKMEAFPLVAKDGLYEMRWVNQLEEMIIYDEAALIVVDHPADISVFPNERLMPAPPYPERQLYAVRGERAPARTLDHRGRDVSELVRDKDRRYPDDFELLPFKGYAEPHALTLDLGELERGESYVLLMNGWVDYADSSSNLAASQAGVSMMTPYLEVGDAEGRFELALPEMGFPAGLPKTMLVDLTGLVTPEKNRVRITTSMRLYWDQILIAQRVESSGLRLVELSPRDAELRFTGYPQRFDPDGREPALYTYDTIAATDLWGAHEGYYTRYGDVRELVEAADDQYVITHHGDELRLTFEASELAPLRDGWTRSFMALADGFGKDMDLNSARPDHVEPLPFHGMSAYPYPEGEAFPSSSAHRRYNTRYVGRDGVSGNSND
jgi:tetratricopeptide (TPR) repeat protein